MDLLNTIGTVGDSIDKITGGRALRGALAGKPREIASFVPYSDSIGLTNEKDKTSGRDLTDQYGLTSKGSNSFGSHAAGFLADTVLSPGNLIGAYGSFKAAPTIAKGLAGAGKALVGLDLLDGFNKGAKTAGRVADPVADYAKLTAHFPKDQPLGMYQHIQGEPGMSMLEEGARNHGLTRQMIDRRTGHAGGMDDLYHAHQTTLPVGQQGSPDFSGAGHFHQGPPEPMSGGGMPITDEQWASMMGGNPVEHASLGTAFAGRRPVTKASGWGDVGTSIPPPVKHDVDTYVQPYHRAEQLGQEAGVPTRLWTPYEVGLYNGKRLDPLTSKTGAWYSGQDHAIGLNPLFDGWHDNQLMQMKMDHYGPAETGGLGWWSSNHPDSIIHHELGHAMHREGLGLDQYRNSQNLFELPKEHAQYLANNLSRYGASSPKEAVAEIVSALHGNRQFTPEVQSGVAKLLHHYGGEGLWQRLGDSKLLKPIGYSLLAALTGGGVMGTTGASNGGPQQPEQFGAA